MFDTRVTEIMLMPFLSFKITCLPNKPPKNLNNEQETIYLESMHVKIMLNVASSSFLFFFFNSCPYIA